MKALTIKLIIFLALLIAKEISAQRLYFDPIVSAALALHANTIEDAQEETIEEQTKLQQAQAFVATQMVIVNNIQNKVYRGLREVNGTVSNGIQVLRIGDEIVGCYDYMQKIGDIVAEHPQYAPFGASATEFAYQQVIRSISEMQELFADEDTNLAFAGDRVKILLALQDRVTKLKLNLIGVHMAIERASRLGFWRAINPFQGYINTDQSIVQNIMERYRTNF